MAVAPAPPTAPPAAPLAEGPSIGVIVAIIAAGLILLGTCIFLLVYFLVLARRDRECDYDDEDKRRECEEEDWRDRREAEPPQREARARSADGVREGGGVTLPTSSPSQRDMHVTSPRRRAPLDNRRRDRRQLWGRVDLAGAGAAAGGAHGRLGVQMIVAHAAPGAVARAPRRRRSSVDSDGERRSAARAVAGVDGGGAWPANGRARRAPVGGG